MPDPIALLIAEAATALGVADAEPDPAGGLVIQAASGLHVGITANQIRRTVDLIVPLGDAAADLATLRRALGANRTARGAGGGAFALDEENDCLILVRRLPVEGTSPAALAEAVAALAEAAGRFLAAAPALPAAVPAMPAGLRA